MPRVRALHQLRGRRAVRRNLRAWDDLLNKTSYPNTSTLSDSSTILSKSVMVEIGQTPASFLPRISKHVPHAYRSPFNSLYSATFLEISKCSVSAIVSSSDPSLIKKIVTS